MSIGALLVGIAMLLLAVPFVINPLLRGAQKEDLIETSEEHDTPGSRHAELLMALRDLDFDHQIGKISDEDYSNLRGTLLVQAAAALEAQDKLDAELDAQLEQAIRLHRENQTKSFKCIQCGASLDNSDRFCRNCGHPVETACPNCGGKLNASDLFCNSCGASLSSIPTPAPAESST